MSYMIDSTAEENIVLRYLDIEQVEALQDNPKEFKNQLERES